MTISTLKALDIAKQFMTVATDWNLDEVEIDGEMRDTYELIEQLEQVIEREQALSKEVTLILGDKQ